MPASDLFLGPGDAEFRLLDTYIIVGRVPYKVLEVIGSPFAFETQIGIHNIETGSHQRVRLDRLPTRAMYDCPHGYRNGVWYSRGTARCRYQGITASAMWARNKDGSISQGCYEPLENLLPALLKQPRVAPRKITKGIVTRDVFIQSSGLVLVRGIAVGRYDEGRLDTPLNLPSHYLELLRNARITV
jgi:hypothetical protein